MSIKKTLLKACGAGGGGCDPDAHWISNVDPAAGGLYNSSTVVDSKCNTYVTGYGKIENSTYFSSFVAKYTSSGQLEWFKTIDQATADNSYGAQDIAVDSSDNVLIAYYPKRFQSPTAFNKISLIKINGDGDTIWNKDYTPSTNRPISYPKIVADSSDNIYCAFDWDDGTLVHETVALLKVNSTGAVQWTRFLYSSYNTRPTGVAVDSSDNPYVTADDGSSTTAIVAKYNPSGTLQWQKSFTGYVTGYNSEDKAIAFDSSDNIYIVRNEFLSNTYKQDFLTIKLNSSGTLQWARKLQISERDYARSVAVDSEDNIYVVGTASAASTPVNAGMIAKYNSSGVLQWTRALQYSSSYIVFLDIDTDNDDQVVVTGYTGTDYNVVTAKLPSDGSGTGTYGSYSYSTVSPSDTSYSMTAANSSLTSSSTLTTITASTQSDSLSDGSSYITETLNEIS